MKISQRPHGRWRLVSVLLLFTLVLAACGSANNGGSTSTGSTTTASAPMGKGCKKVGVLLPETDSSARWDSKDKPALTDGIKKAIPGAQVDYQNASNNATTQQSQADGALANGDCILVVAPVDGTAAAAIVTKAHQSNVPVIAYDRLIDSNDLDYYVSFDNVKVGQAQGQYIADHYQEYISGSNNNIIMINGSQTDNNALLFKQGALSALQPLFDSHKLTLKYSTFTPAWQASTAQQETDGALTANGNNIQIAYVANDGMATAVIASLQSHGLKHVLVTGQDATPVGIQQILEGTQAMTVYKKISLEADSTIKLVKALSDGTSTASITNGGTVTVPVANGKNIPSILLPITVVDRTNIIQTVLADGYVTKADICTNLPAGTNTEGIC